MADQSPKKIKKITPKPSKSRPIKILCVEDSAVIRDTIAKLLELKGFNVSYARNGKEGVEQAIRLKPDVILMDLRMPVMDGYKAIKALKLNASTNHLPIIVVSAWGSKTERAQARAAGADQFFVKPPDLDNLIEAINDVAGIPQS